MSANLAVQIAAVRARLETCPAGLVRHVLRVLEEAVALARHWDVDTQRVELATWGHDLFRAHAPTEQLQLARESGIAVDPADEASPVLLHGPIAAAVLRQRFGVVDDDVLAAVRDHTLGLAEMPLLAKILLLADKVERHKRDRAPLMREVRLLARRDLDTALLCWADWKWVDERTRGWGSHPLHWRARVAWVAEHHADAALPARVSAARFAAAARE